MIGAYRTGVTSLPTFSIDWHWWRGWVHIITSVWNGAPIYRHDAAHIVRLEMVEIIDSPIHDSVDCLSVVVRVGEPEDMPQFM